MGLLVGIAGLASAIIGKKSADKAAASANQGFDYLRNNPMVQSAQSLGTAALADRAMWGQKATAYGERADSYGSRIDALLGLGGDTQAAQNAFADYRDSTGYNFRLGQGMDTITGSAAARGLLDSGSTAKALTEYGQNIGAAEFGNYLQQLAGRETVAQGRENVALGREDMAQGRYETGLNAAYNVASQGTSAGTARGNFIRQGAQDVTGGLGMAVGGVRDWYLNRTQ